MSQAEQDRRIDYIEFPVTDMEAAKQFYGAEVVEPKSVYVNLMAAIADGGPAHTDNPRFHGRDRTDRHRLLALTQMGRALDASGHEHLVDRVLEAADQQHLAVPLEAAVAGLWHRFLPRRGAWPARSRDKIHPITV